MIEIESPRRGLSGVVGNFYACMEMRVVDAAADRSAGALSATPINYHGMIIREHGLKPAGCWRKSEQSCVFISDQLGDD